MAYCTPVPSVDAYTGVSVPGAGTQSNPFVAQLAVGGTTNWALQLGNTAANPAGSSGVSTVGIDAGNNIMIAGLCYSAFDLGFALGCAASGSSYLLKMDSGGAPLWGKAYTGGALALPTFTTAPFAMVSGNSNGALDLGTELARFQFADAVVAGATPAHSPSSTRVRKPCVAASSAVAMAFALPSAPAAGNALTVNAPHSASRSISSASSLSTWATASRWASCNSNSRSTSASMAPVVSSGHSEKLILAEFCISPHTEPMVLAGPDRQSPDLNSARASRRPRTGHKPP